MREPQFHRIRRLPPYVFSEVNAMKAAARAAGRDIIDLGMGNPDSPTPRPIVDKLIEAVQNPRTHRYSTSRGIPGLRRAHAAYYERRFGVRLEPESEIVVTLGSKEGLANLAQAITAPGDVILVPNPSLPDPSLRLHHRGRGDPPRPDHADHEFADRAGARHRAFGTAADRDRAQLSLEPDRPSRRPRLLPGDRRVCAPARDLHPVRSRLRRDLLRDTAAIDPSGARRQGPRGRVHLDEQDLQHARLADRLRRRQPEPDRGTRAHQIVPRLRRLHADPGGCDRGAERLPGLRRRGPRPATASAATF